MDTQQDDFDAAFAQFSKEEDTGVKTEVPDAQAAPDTVVSDADPAPADPPADVGSDPAPVAADPAEAAPSGESGDAPTVGDEVDPTPAADAGDPAPDPAPAPDADADAILKRLATIVKETDPAPATKDEPAPKQEEMPLYSADEQTAIEAYEKDWSEVSRAEELKWKGRANALLQYAFEEIRKELEPLKALTNDVANHVHFKEVTEKVGPVDDNLRSQVDTWISKQPGYLQAAYNQVLSTGTVDEVADLVDRVKKANTTATPTPKPSQGDTELSDAAKKAAEALAPVGSKRTVIEQQDDPSDYDGAWRKFSAEFDKS